MKVLLVNGPPRCGKDTLGRAICQEIDGAVVLKMAEQVKLATHVAYGLVDHLGRPYPADSFEHCKDQPAREFLGLTPRQAYIKHSEIYMKLLHGPEIFGQLWVRRAKLLPRSVRLIVVTDSGFYEENLPVMDEFGACNVSLIRIRREGTTFDHDSRRYIHLPVDSHELENIDQHPEHLVNGGLCIAHKMLE